MEKRIVVDDKNVRKIVKSEIERLGLKADLNHIDVSGVTNMYSLFEYSDFNGDISNWDVSNVESMREIFYDSKFKQDISNWNINLKKLKEKPYNFDFNNTKFIKSIINAYKNNNKNKFNNLSRKVYINHIRKRLKI